MTSLFKLVLIVQLCAVAFVDLRGASARTSPLFDLGGSTHRKPEIECDNIVVGNQTIACAFGKRAFQEAQVCVDAWQLPSNNSCALSLSGWNPPKGTSGHGSPLTISFSKGGLSLWNVSHNLSVYHQGNLTESQGLGRFFSAPKPLDQIQNSSKEGEIVFNFPPETLPKQLSGVGGLTGLRLSFFVLGSMEFSIEVKGIEAQSGNTTITQMGLPRWNKSIVFYRWMPMEHFFSFTKPVRSVHLRVTSHGISELALTKVRLNLSLKIIKYINWMCFPLDPTF